jgi:hypothetical protein
MITKMTPLGAIARGVVAGAAGAFALGALMKMTSRMMPQPPAGSVDHADEKQKREMPPETVARRFVEDFMRRGPLGNEAKARGGEIVHVGFGAMWGAMYGANYGTHRLFHGPLGSALYGAIVWGISDNLILPAFRLGPPIRKQSAAGHLYMLVAHLAYGEALWLAYEGLRSKTWLPLVAPIAARWSVRAVPKLLRPAAYRVIETVAEQRPVRRVRDAALALAAEI